MSFSFQSAFKVYINSLKGSNFPQALPLVFGQVLVSAYNTGEPLYQHAHSRARSHMHAQTHARSHTHTRARLHTCTLAHVHTLIDVNTTGPWPGFPTLCAVILSAHFEPQTLEALFLTATSSRNRRKSPAHTANATFLRSWHRPAAVGACPSPQAYVNTHPRAHAGG